MIFIYLLILLIVLGVLVAIGIRGVREFLLYKVKQQELNQLQKRKVAFLAHQSQRKNQLVLLASCGFLTFGLLLSLGATVTQARQAKQQNNQLKETIDMLKIDLTALQRTALYAYPDEGARLDHIDWENVLTSNTQDVQFEAEQEIEKQLTPYLGRTMALISVDPPMQELHVTIVNSLGSDSELATWKDNLQPVLKELEAIKFLTQLSFSVQVLDNPDVSLEETYTREENGGWQQVDGTTTKENTTEQKADAEKNTREKATEQKGSVEIDE